MKRFKRQAIHCAIFTPVQSVAHLPAGHSPCTPTSMSILELRSQHACFQTRVFMLLKYQLVLRISIMLKI